MNLTVILDIAIGLIFIYLILSLLAAEIQELIATLLQWRATHLKESIEVLLSGGRGTAEEKRIKELTDRLYANPLIKNINQEAQGKIETSFRNIGWNITKFYRGETGKEGSVFGQNPNNSEDEKITGPSYIPAETFTTTLLETSQITILNQKLSQLRLKQFKEEQFKSVEDIVKDIKDNLKGDDKSKLETELLELNLKLEQIVVDFKNSKADLITSFDRIGYRLNEFSAYLPKTQELNKEGNINEDAKILFHERMNSLIQDIFEKPEKKTVALGWLKPSLNEIIEAINNKESTTYQEVIEVMTNVLKAQAVLRIEKIKDETLIKTRASLSDFETSNQETVAAIFSNLNTEFEQLENEINKVVIRLRKSELDLSASLEQMEKVLNDYITRSENYLPENNGESFRKQMPSLRQVTLEISKDETLNRITTIVDNLKLGEGLNEDTKRDTLARLNEEFEWLKKEFNKIIEKRTTDLSISLEQMTEKLEDYTNRSGNCFHKGASSRNEFVDEQQVKSIKLTKEDFVRQVKAIKHNVFYTISALPKWLRMNPTEIKEQISLNAEIYRKIVEAVNDKEGETYQGIVAAINDLPQPVKESLSVLGRRAQEKVERVEQEFEQFQQEVEIWFDRSMDRASGVYRRNARGVAILIGFLIALAANADSFHMVNRLSKDGDLRNAITQNAQALTTNCPPTTSPSTPPVGESPPPLTQLDCIRMETDTALEKVTLPIGWSADKLTEQWKLPNENNRKPKFNSLEDWLAWLMVHILLPVLGFALLIFLGILTITTRKVPTEFKYLLLPLLCTFTVVLVIFTGAKVIVGWFLSAVAISMGAPFWFDLLGKVINVRNTGNKPASSAKNEATSKEQASSTRSGS